MDRFNQPLVNREDLEMKVIIPVEYECKWCCKATRSFDGQCDNCWEMATRIERDPKIAIKMLKEFGELNDKA